METPSQHLLEQVDIKSLLGRLVDNPPANAEQFDHVDRAILEFHYQQTCLARQGMSFDQALEIPVVKKSLIRAAQASFCHAARSATPLMIHQNQPEAA